jgi:CheY-like chemotaxis protein
MNPDKTSESSPFALTIRSIIVLMFAYIAYTQWMTIFMVPVIALFIATIALLYKDTLFVKQLIASEQQLNGDKDELTVMIQEKTSALNATNKELKRVKIALESATQFNHKPLSSASTRESEQDNLPLNKRQDEKMTGEVLIAEDTPLLQQLERRMLEGVGVIVTVANNGQEAVDLAMKQHFDLILMDMQMPVMDGIEATRIIKERGDQPPIIAVSANTVQKYRDAFEQAGCNGFIAKPFEKETLTQILEKYLTQENVQPKTTKVSDVDEELMGAFYKDAADNLQALSAALRQSDFKMVRKVAHNIKGSAALFGFPELSDQGKEVCDAIDSDQSDHASALTEALVEALEKIERTEGGPL